MAAAASADGASDGSESLGKGEHTQLDRITRPDCRQVASARGLGIRWAHNCSSEWRLGVASRLGLIGRDGSFGTRKP